jgi:hypothetical protein
MRGGSNTKEAPYTSLTAAMKPDVEDAAFFSGTK